MNKDITVSMGWDNGSHDMLLAGNKFTLVEIPLSAPLTVPRYFAFSLFLGYRALLEQGVPVSILDVILIICDIGGINSYRVVP